jgi:hypothetical protein
MKLLASMGFLLLFGSLGCSKEVASYDYEFMENGVDGGVDGGTAGCDTGNQTFPSLVEMCAGLQSDSLNHGCALSSRENFFGEKCTGTFQETN